MVKFLQPTISKKYKYWLYGTIVFFFALIIIASSSEEEPKTITEQLEIQTPTLTNEVQPQPDVQNTEKLTTIEPSPNTNEQKSNEIEEKPTSSSSIFYRVTKVVDGDTIKVDINGTIETLRLIGLDTPETVDPRKPVECFGIEASNRAKSLLEGQKVALEADPTQGDKGRYNRLLKYVFLDDGRNYNKLMISEGYAYEYTYNTPYKYQAEFKQAEREAREAKRGLWADDACTDEIEDEPEQSSEPPPIAEENSVYKFYTSSYYSAKFYYCETDEGWKSLSEKNFKSFDSEQSLLEKYKRVLHEPCE